MSLPLPATDNLVSFPRADLRAAFNAAVKRHRLPEELGQALMRDAANFPEVSPYAALAFAIDQRLKPDPLDLEKASGILLVGARGSGKSAVAAKLSHAAGLIGRKVEVTRADNGLALFRTNSNPPDVLTVMEADSFNPLNPRAASAFSALSEVTGVHTVGVVSALNDAEDVSDLVSTFHFRRVIVTQMDLTRRLGATLAACLTGARLAHVTYGPHAEDGLAMLSPGIIATQLMEMPRL
jgi:signal recognition particle GTPase